MSLLLIVPFYGKLIGIWKVGGNFRLTQMRKISCQHMWNFYTVCVCAYLKHHIYTSWGLIMERGYYDYGWVPGIRNLFPLKVGEELRIRFRHTMSKSDLYFELPPLHHRVLATFSSKYMMLLPDLFIKRRARLWIGVITHPRRTGRCVRHLRRLYHQER